MTDHVSGKTILITGAGGGFGRLVSLKAASAGAKIVATDINEAGLKETVDMIEAEGGTAYGMAGDVSKLEDLKGLSAKAVELHGRVDVMINNAGVMPLAFYSDHEAAKDAWYRCIDINIKGVLNGMISVYDQMMAQGAGHIINISSIYGNFPTAGAGVYGASKAAVNFLSESLRVESQGKIKVTIVKPTGVPATNLGAGVINPEAIVGILGQNAPTYLATMAALAEGKGTPEQMDVERPEYAALDPGYIADAVIHAINQPAGVSVGDITMRATGDAYIL